MPFFGTPTVENNSQEPTEYTLEDLKTKGELKEVISGELWMLTKIEMNDGEPFRIEFAFFEEGQRGLDVLMHGQGLAGSLRECRHTYWGDEGYIFYPNFKKMKAIFKELYVYFDDME